MRESTTPSLVFGIAIEQLDQRLKNWTAKINDFANNGGKGYRLKIDFGEAETIIKNLSKLKIGDNSEIVRLQTELDNVKKKLREVTGDSTIRNAAKNIAEPLRRGADESKKVADAIEQNRKRVVDAYADMMRSVNALQSDRAHARGLGIDIGGSSQLVQDIKAFASEMSRLSGKNGIMGNKDAVDGLLSQYRNYLDVIRMLRNEIKGLSSVQEQQSRKAASQKIIDSRSVNEAIYQIYQLEKRLSALRDLQSKAGKAGILTPDLDSLIKDMEKYMRKFQQIYQNGGRLPDGTTAQTLKSEGDYRGLTARIAENTRETRINIAARNTAIATVNLLASEEQRLAQALTSSTNAMKGQSQVLQDLRTLAKQYFSVWGAKTILDNIIQTGGLLEQQRMSIGAILGDISQANQLFENIKSLALRSPFGVVQLDTMSKQLTAYDFSYNEIFDWVKRIGDISAATGTEASRLALALGHVKSEGALTGYTLRQFAMGNVPLLATLAKQLNRTTAEIRKMTREKAISYDDVVTALKSMTEGDGLFANAQETMSQALNAKFKNLHDAFDLMWGDIAESGVGDVLKSVATNLTELTKSWKPLVTDMTAAVGLFGLLKTGALVYNSALGKTTASTMANALALKKKEVEQLRVANSYRTLTTVEQIKVKTASRLNAYDLQLLLNTKKLTGEELLRSVAMGNTNKAMAIAAVRTSRLTEAERQLLITQMQSLNGTRRMAMMWTTFTNGIRRAATAVVGFMSQMAPLAAMMVVTDAWMSKKADEDAIKDRLDGMREKAVEGYKNLQELQKQYFVGGSKGMDNTLLSQSIDEMVEKLKDYSLTANEAFNNAFEVDKEGKAVHSLSEQYDILAKAIEDTAESYRRYQEMIPMIEHALESSTPDKNFLERIGDSMYGWMLGDNAKAMTGGLTQALENYTKQVKEAVLAENLFLRSRMEVLSSLQNLGFENVLSMENEELLHFINTMRNESPETFQKFYQSLDDASKDALNSMTNAWNDMNTAYELANQRMRKAGNDLYLSMKAAWGDDMKKWPEGWRNVVMMAMNNATGDVKEFADLSVDYQNLVRDSFLKPFKISVDSDEAQERVNNLLVDLQNLVGKDWTIKIGIKGEDSFADVDSAQKVYKDAQEKIKKAEDQLKALGNPKLTDTGITEQAKKVIEDYNTQIARRSAARSVLLSYGATPEEPKEKNTASTGRKHTEDALALRWQNRIDILKKYRSEMEKYEKVMSRQQAIEKLKANGNFAQMFSEKWFTNPDDFTGSIDEAIKALGTATDRRKALVAKWGAEKEDFLGDEFRHDIEMSVNELGRLISVMAENYDTYKKWMDLTGDSNFAASIAGVTQNSSMSDWLNSKMEDLLKKAGDSRSASEVFGLSESEVSKFGENSGIYKLWEEWQNNNNKIKKQNLELYTEAIKNAKGYAEKVADIKRELEEQKAAIDKMAKSQTDKDRLKQNATDNANKKIANLTWENFKATEEWGRIFSDLDRISTGTLTRMLAKLRDIAPSMNDSAESTKAVYEAIDRLQTIVNGRNPIKAISDSLSNRSALGKYYKQASQKGSLVANAELSQLLGVQLGSTVSKDQIKDAMKNESEDFKNAIAKVVDGLQTFQNGLNLVGDLFDSMGMSGASNIASDAAGLLGGALSGASSLSALGPWGMAAGAALGLASGIFQLHDKSLQRQIEAIQEEVDALETNTQAIKTYRERTFGYDDGELRRSMSKLYKETSRTKEINIFGKSYQFKYDSAALNAMREYYQMNSSGSGYAQELANLKQQREDYIKMYDLENDKKKKSQDALDEYRNKIAELDEQIRYFAEDLAKDLWSIDLKEWADQIGDSLMTAFENGENAAEAFKDTVQDIMRQVLRKMLSLGIIQPMMENLQKKLFGENGKAGIFNANNPEGTIDAAMREVSAFFGEGGEGQKMIEATQTFYNKWQALMRSNGLTLEDNGSSSSSGSSIKSITEQTADLIASYINAVRADVSVIRALTTQYFVMYYTAITSGNESLKNIENHTAAIMRSNEEIARLMKSLDDRFRGLENKTWKLPIA